MGLLDKPQKATQEPVSDLKPNGSTSTSNLETMLLKSPTILAKIEGEEPSLDLAQYGRDIIEYKESPERLDSIQLDLIGWYAYYAAKMIPLEIGQATFWEKFKGFDTEKPKSDPYVRALWKISKEGKEMVELERTLKTIHIMISSLKASLNRHNNEMRNIK